ncbi:MAG: hypothetical protein AAGA56_19990 [Myxococcota bacterium]
MAYLSYMMRSLAFLALFSLVFNQGCLMYAVAGAVELNRDQRLDDPLGDEYEAPTGEIGWRAEERELSLRNIAWGTVQIGCDPVNAKDGGFIADCPRGLPTILAKENDGKLFRMCAGGTERLDCRLAWERVGRELASYVDEEQ